MEPDELSELVSLDELLEELSVLSEVLELESVPSELEVSVLSVLLLEPLVSLPELVCVLVEVAVPALPVVPTPLVTPLVAPLVTPPGWVASVIVPPPVSTPGFWESSSLPSSSAPEPPVTAPAPEVMLSLGPFFLGAALSGGRKPQAGSTRAKLAAIKVTRPIAGRRTSITHSLGARFTLFDHESLQAIWRGAHTEETKQQRDSDVMRASRCFWALRRTIPGRPRPQTPGPISPKHKTSRPRRTMDQEPAFLTAAISPCNSPPF